MEIYNGRLDRDENGLDPGQNHGGSGLESVLIDPDPVLHPFPTQNL